MGIEIQIPKDTRKIDLNNLGELIWWSNHLDICPETLLGIINKVGPSLEKIKEYYRLNRAVIST